MNNMIVYALIQNQQFGGVFNFKSSGKHYHMIVVLLLVSTVAFVTEAEGTDSPSSSPSKALNSTAPTSKPVPTPIQRCLFGLANSGFDLFAIERYNDWMDNDTTFETAETGVRKFTWV